MTTARHRKCSSAVTRTLVVTGVSAAVSTILAAPALADGGDNVDWAAVARCESGGNPAATDPSGQHVGMYQFTRSTWRANGGRGDPRQASPREQTRVAENVKHTQGMGAWPVCGRHAHDGYRPRLLVAHPGWTPRHAAPEPREHGVHRAPVEGPRVRPVAQEDQQAGTYRVVSGDTLWGIATRDGVPGGWPRVARVNPQVQDPNVIQPGWVLEIPGRHQ